jgi:hypothetical protein
MLFVVDQLQSIFTQCMCMSIARRRRPVFLPENRWEVFTWDKMLLVPILLFQMAHSKIFV